MCQPALSEREAPGVFTAPSGGITGVSPVFVSNKTSAVVPNGPTGEAYLYPPPAELLAELQPSIHHSLQVSLQTSPEVPKHGRAAGEDDVLQRGRSECCSSAGEDDVTCSSAWGRLTQQNRVVAEPSRRSHTAGGATTTREHPELLQPGASPVKIS